jgi:hypothetical protein
MKEPFTTPYKVTSTFQDHINSPDKVRRANAGTDVVTRPVIGAQLVAEEKGWVSKGIDIYGALWIYLHSEDGVRVWSHVHLSKVLIRTSQKVNEGDVIGLTGDTGYIDGAHTHWGCKVNRKLVDPFSLFNQEYTDMTLQEKLFNYVNATRPDVMAQYKTVDEVWSWFTQWGFNELLARLSKELKTPRPDVVASIGNDPVKGATWLVDWGVLEYPNIWYYESWNDELKEQEALKLQVADLQKQLDSCDSRCDAMQGQIDSLSVESGTLTEYLEKNKRLELQLASTQAQVNELTSQMATYTSENDRMQLQIKNQQTEIKNKEKKIEELKVKSLAAIDSKQLFTEFLRSVFKRNSV